MKRHILFLLSLSLLGMIDANGQITFMSNNQQFICDAVKPGLFLSRQSFQVCDANGDLYGLHGGDEFGVSHSLGVKVPGGVLLTDAALRPWEYNSDYGKYRDSYSPVFYSAKHSPLAESVKYDSLTYNLADQKELVDTTLYRLPSDTFEGKGFVIDTAEGEKDGWLVWVAPDENDDYEGAVNWQYSIYRKEISVSKEKFFFDIDKPGVYKRVLGGIFVVPVYTGIGAVEFRLCGVLVPAGEKWKLCCPFIGEPVVGEAPSEDAGPTPIAAKPADGGDELTPIGGISDDPTDNAKKKKTK